MGVETHLCSCSTRSMAFLRDSSSLAICTHAASDLVTGGGAKNATLNSYTRVGRELLGLGQRAGADGAVARCRLYPQGPGLGSDTSPLGRPTQGLAWGM